MIKMVNDGSVVDMIGPYTLEEVNEKYLEMLPKIEKTAKIAFRDLTADKKDDAIQSVRVHSYIAVQRLAEQGRLDDAFFTPLSWHAIFTYRDGRIAGVPMNSTDVMAERCRHLKRSKVKYDRLCDTITDSFESEATASDARYPVHRTVHLRIDFFQTWLVAQSERNQQIIQDLAMGDTTNEVAAKYGLSAARVSQLRKEYKKSWYEFIDPSDDTDVI